MSYRRGLTEEDAQALTAAVEIFQGNLLEAIDGFVERRAKLTGALGFVTTKGLAPELEKGVRSLVRAMELRGYAGVRLEGGANDG